MNLRKTARGQECLVRLPGVCNHDSSTVVLAHLNGGGMGAKRPDYQAAFACSACHDECDRRTRKLDPSNVKRWHLEGVIRTQEWWIQEGYLKW